MEYSTDVLEKIIALISGDAGIIALLTMIIIALGWRVRTLEKERTEMSKEVIRRLEEAESRAYTLLKEANEARRRGGNFGGDY